MNSSRFNKEINLSLCIFILALIVRILYIFEDFSNNPFSHYFFVDAREYNNLALGFLKGTWPGEKAFFRPPLYPIFIGAIYKLLGPNILSLKLFQAVLGSLSCVGIFLIARIVTLSFLSSIIAALICTLSGTFIYFDGQPLSASIDVFLMLSSVLSLLWAQNNKRNYRKK